jgi:hypothetical protein
MLLPLKALSMISYVIFLNKNKKKEAHVATSEGLEHDVLCDCMLVVFQDCIKIQDA